MSEQVTQVTTTTRDPVVGRVNDLTTTFLDTLGVLLLAAGIAYGAWATWGLGWAFAAAGLTVTVLSTMVQARQQPRRPAKVPPGAHPHPPAPLPGPEDPGPLHVRGG